MIRGASPTHTATLPYKYDKIQDLWVTYSQNNPDSGKIETVFEKDLEDVQFYNDYRILIPLSSEDTRKLRASSPFIGTRCYVQIEVVTKDGLTNISKPVILDVCDALHQKSAS